MEKCKHTYLQTRAQYQVRQTLVLTSVHTHFQHNIVLAHTQTHTYQSAAEIELNLQIGCGESSEPADFLAIRVHVGELECVGRDQ